MKEFIYSFQFNSTIALLVYWIPAIICIVVYFIGWINDYKYDLTKCNEKWYEPRLILGKIFWQIIISIVPAVNLFALVFDVMGDVFRYLYKFFSIPLVRNKYKEENK